MARNSTTSVIPASGGQGAISPETSPFVIILNAMLDAVDRQGGKTALGLDREMTLMGYFNAQQATVAAEEAKLSAFNTLIGNEIAAGLEVTPEDLQVIQAQLARVQAEQSKLNNLQNGLVQEFKANIDPAQQMTQICSVMFGAMLHSLILTENTRVK